MAVSRQARRRVELEMRGLCTRCGMNEPAEGRKQCDECLEKGRTYAASKPYVAKVGRVRRYNPKAPHVVRKNEQRRLRRRERAAAGLCVVCVQPVSGFVRCAACREKQNAYWRMRRRQGGLADTPFNT